jgi:hypothetical protein
MVLDEGRPLTGPAFFVFTAVHRGLKCTSASGRLPSAEAA